jgi:hypothetical protein
MYKSKIPFTLLYNSVITKFILYFQINFPSVHILYHPLLSNSFVKDFLLGHVQFIVSVQELECNMKDK